MTGIIGILLALVLLMYLAYRGISVLILAPTMALLAVLFEPGTPILGTYTQIFMSALGNFILAGITGSASGGMSIALQTLGANYVEMAEAAGVSLELMHRVTSVATGGLDALPHNGAVITLLAICGQTHQQAYKDIFVVAVLIPIIALIVLIMVGSFLGSF